MVFGFLVEGHRGFGANPCLAEEGLNQGSDALRNHTDHASHAGLATDLEPV
jgi:hypothetical protein